MPDESHARAPTKRPAVVDGATGVISTEDQVVKIRTPRGYLTVGPHGKISGLWKICERELRTAAQVRAMCAGTGARGRHSTKPIEQRTFSAWRITQGFPGPALTVNQLELWSRTEVEAWLEQRREADLR